MAWEALLAAGAGSALMGYLGNEQAKQASNKALKEAAGQREESKKYLEEINPAEIEALNQAYLQSLGIEGSGLSYTPDEYQYIAMPEYMKNTYLGDAQSTSVQDSPLMKMAQLWGLANLQNRAETGLDAKSKAEFLRAQRGAGEFAKGREGAIINDMQAKGMGGSNMEAALRMMAGQQGADMLSQSMSDQASVDANHRLQAQLQALDTAGQIRGQDVDTSALNANILNQFALTNSARRQQVQNMNTQLMNDRLKDNTSEMRNVSSGNIDLRNKAQLANIDLEKARQASQNQNLMTQYGGGMGAYEAGSAKQQSLANAALGGITESYAKGAANAGYERDKYNSIGSLFPAMGNAYTSYYDKKEAEEKEAKEKGIG
jgi:hypothetical protein